MVDQLHDYDQWRREVLQDDPETPATSLTLNHFLEALSC